MNSPRTFPSESRCEQIRIRGLRCNVRHWGSDDAPAFFLTHGWMDTSASFQFVVDALACDWHVIAPDWRGYGDSEWLLRPYWFPDYLVDLDHILAHYSPERPARLVGHSMGANIVSMYAATRPQRVSQLALLDFLGLSATVPEDAPVRLENWLDELRTEPQMRRYKDHDALARRLLAVNPRLTPERAGFLSRHVSRRLDDGTVQMACDPWHKLTTPMLYRIEEAMVYWRAITAPVLMAIADHGIVRQRFADIPGEEERRMACFANLQVATISDSGHNLQHDQPEQVASALERFLRRD